MIRSEQSLAVADLAGIVDVSQIENVGSLDFLELGKRLLQLQIGRIELSLVQIVIDRLTGDRVSEGNFDMHKCPREALAGIVVELSCRTLIFEEWQRDKCHLSRALDRHGRFVRLEDLVPLSGNHVVAATDIEQSGQKLRSDTSEGYGHLLYLS